MKRIWTMAGVIALVLALTVTAVALAQDTGATPDPTATSEPEATPAAPYGPRYTDEDGDGACDFAGMRGGMMGGAAFVDEDGDGVCDNCPAGAQQGQAYGRGSAMMGGRGMMGGGMWGQDTTDDDTDAWTRPGGMMGRGMSGRSWSPRW